MSKWLRISIVVLTFLAPLGCSQRAVVTLPGPNSITYTISIKKAYVFENSEVYKAFIILEKKGNPFIKDDEEEIHLYFIQDKTTDTKSAGFYVDLYTRPTPGYSDTSKVHITKDGEKFKITGQATSTGLIVALPVCEAKKVVQNSELTELDSPFFVSIIKERFPQWLRD